MTSWGLGFAPTQLRSFLSMLAELRKGSSSAFLPDLLVRIWEATGLDRLHAGKEKGMEKEKGKEKEKRKEKEKQKDVHTEGQAQIPLFPRCSLHGILEATLRYSCGLTLLHKGLLTP